jgi:cysteine desulfurase/selenocysteine lyase
LKAVYPMQNPQMQKYRQQEFSAVTTQGIYLNHAGISPAPARVVSAVTDAVRQSAQDPLKFVTEIVLPARDEARARLARLMGVPAENLALTKNTGQGLALVADALKLDPGDNIVSVSCEYPSVVFPWYAQADRGIETRLVTPRPDGTFTADDLDAVMDARTRVVTLSWIQFGTGFRCDLPSITAAAHARGAIVVLDVIQGLGALPINIEALGIDAAASGVHKWLLAPGGTGGLYLAPRLLDRLRLVNMGAASVVDMMKFDPLDFMPKPNAQRYEEGVPNFLGLVGLNSALSLLEEVGIEAIGAQILALSEYAADRLEAKGCRVVSPRADPQRAGLVMFQHPALPNEAVLQALTAAKVTAAVRGGSLRFSPHFYNTTEEIDHAVDALPV